MLMRRPCCSIDTAVMNSCRCSGRTSTASVPNGARPSRSPPIGTVALQGPVMLYLALSCFQGRRMSDAALTLVGLAPGRVGLQLTPGCAPDAFTVDCPTRTHHGFTHQALRARVWERGALLWQGDSVHPPLARDVPDGWRPPD